MSRSAVILRNVASNWVGFAVNAGVTLVLTPFVLSHLGPARYGLWILASSIIGYYGLLDIGFRAGVTQYLTRYIAIGDRTRASQCLSSAVAVLASLGALMFCLSLGAAYLAPQFFAQSTDLEREAFWCILIIGSSSGIQFALQPFSSVFTATQRFDIANAIGISTRLLTAGAIVIALRNNLGLVGLSSATCAASAIDYVIRWRIASRLAPELEVSMRQAGWERVREISAFGAWNFLASINTFVYQHVPNIVIASVMPVAAVGHYALTTGLTRHINSVLNPVPQVLYPAATELHMRGERRALERLYHDGSRLMLLVMITVVLVAAFWAEDFYRLWIGIDYLSGVPFHSVALLFEVLLISVFTNYSSTIAAQILTGAGHVRTVSTALICGSLLNLGISIALINQYGLLGVAIATVTASVIVDLIVMPVMLQRRVGLSVAAFVKHALPRPMLVAAIEAVLFAAIHLMPRPQHWFELVGQGVVAGAGATVIVLWVGLTADERNRLLLGPLSRLVAALRSRTSAASLSPASDDAKG
jgi:O-antigen/teichoic acid export membrane protein